MLGVQEPIEENLSALGPLAWESRLEKAVKKAAGEWNACNCIARS